MVEDIINEEMYDDDIVLSIVDDEIDDIEDAEEDLLTDGDGDSDAVDAVLLGDDYDDCGEEDL